MDDLIRCVVDGCDAVIKNHSWGKIKSGWFFNRDMQDVGYCPDHIPDWVAKWRAQKKG